MEPTTGEFLRTRIWDMECRLIVSCTSPICPQPKTPMSMTQVAVPSHPPDPDLPEDEFACLNLNIIRPSNTQGKLPVMVWIHGA
jgi:carboxylesterase type B